MKYVQPIDSTTIKHLLGKNDDDALQYLNSLLKTTGADNCFESYWFPTVQNLGNPSSHTSI